MTARDDRINRDDDTVGQIEDVYRSDLPRVVRLAYLLSGDRSFAEEAGQEAFVRLFRNWNRARKPRAYLTTVTVNLCRDRGRRVSTASTIPIPQARTEPAPPLPPDLDDTWQAVQELPGPQREVVVLRYWADQAPLGFRGIVVTYAEPGRPGQTRVSIDGRYVVVEASNGPPRTLDDPGASVMRLASAAIAARTDEQPLLDLLSGWLE